MASRARGWNGGTLGFGATAADGTLETEAAGCWPGCFETASKGRRAGLLRASRGAELTGDAPDGGCWACTSSARKSGRRGCKTRPAFQSVNMWLQAPTVELVG